MRVLASATIGDKIVEILSLNGVASENETTYTPPHHSKLGFCCSSKHSFAWGSENKEALFSPSKTVKFKKVFISHGLFLLCVGFPRLYCWAGSAWHSG